ncbi:aldo/keto reductase [Nocardia sp. NPDC050175]|uniref:aldo/keto reductase n=1 Tax=Nocardia sp. NPDC050175 TaxID=3364317 RepID=UPI0037B87DF1
MPYYPLGGFSPLQSQTLDSVAARLNAGPMAVALAWLLRRSPNILLIPGTSSVQHLRDNVAAAGLVLPEDVLADLDAIGRPTCPLISARAPGDRRMDIGGNNEELSIRVAGNLISNDGDVITQWCVAGRGLVMRSLWHVEPLLRDGSLVQVLPDIQTPSADIAAVYAAAAPLPRRTRAVIDHLKAGLGRRITAAAR